MRRFENADWKTLSLTASFAPEAAEDSGANTERAVLADIGVILAGVLGLAAAIDFILMQLNVTPFA